MFAAEYQISTFFHEGKYFSLLQRIKRKVLKKVEVNYIHAPCNKNNHNEIYAELTNNNSSK